MDARTADSQVISQQESWLQRERASGRFYDRLGWVVGAFLVAMVALSIWVLRHPGEPGTLFKSPVIALLLIAILLPAIAIMALYARRVALRRAERGGLGSGRLHIRLVALFTAIAAVPTVLVAIFASLLFQSGLDFWFSNRARNMLEGTVQVAQGAYRYELSSVSDEVTTMSGDLAGYLTQFQIYDPRFQTGLAYQAYNRGLNEAAIVKVNPDGTVNTLAVALGVTTGESLVNQGRIDAAVKTLKSHPQLKSVDARSPGRLAVITGLNYGPDTYLIASKWIDPELAAQMKRANTVLADYHALQNRSRANQLRFNAALLFGALVIVGLSILTALKIADLMVRPVGQLVGAAGQIEQGDFSARVPATETGDEIQTLALAFNRMAGRLEEQTGALRSANTQLETRRAFMEAVLGSVTAGVIAVDSALRVLLLNRSAETLLEKGEGEIEGRDLASVSPELDEFMRGEQAEANVLISSEAVQRTLAVKRVRYQDGAVLTFDDITDQLADQRRAAWSDIARRIAHEIKNPLTPIQLAAERLQRRFGQEVSSDRETFERLTATIVRQVGDLRRMVDEFSNFARMPKPVFRDENVHEIARQALFLHEVAHPAITFTLEPPQGEFRMVCDRRQLAQALTNIVKNGVEAIETRRNRGEHSLAGDRLELKLHHDNHSLAIDVLDTGIGLPEDRDRLTEPYVTTRVRGTGLGLAIVKKIVEEHFGEIAFLDRPGGGTHVRITFDTAKLAALDTGAAAAAAEENQDKDEDA
jgi:two-component system nitrogen regulation sensor histidine kinase NtrY